MVLPWHQNNSLQKIQSLLIPVPPWKQRVITAEQFSKYQGDSLAQAFLIHSWQSRTGCGFRL